MSTERERIGFLAADATPRASSPEDPSTPLDHSFSSPTANAQNELEERTQKPTKRNGTSLSTVIVSHLDQQEKEGLGVVARRRRCSYSMITALYRRGWTAEICSCFFALISLLALVTTLLVHQDRPLPKWPSLITVNALVSIFTSVFRSGIAMALTQGDIPLTYVQPTAWLTSRRHQSMQVAMVPTATKAQRHGGL
jgi:hypothetical protein